MAREHLKALAALLPLAISAPAHAQQDAATAGNDALPSPERLMEVPVTGLKLGFAPPQETLENPVGGDPEAVRRGKENFLSFNCIGCHAPHGGGGMGPSLSNAHWIYGSDPANIYLTIAQGRPAGMPAFGGVLPPQSIWDIVAYVENLSKDPEDGRLGSTISAKPQRPTVEQVPAELIDTLQPWEHTQPFSDGQRP